MSDEKDKFKNSKRRLKDDNAIQKQLKIAKDTYHINPNDLSELQQPHRLAKHHVMNCGKPNCMLCANPRKIFKEKTIQEKRFDQNMDYSRDKKSNGNKQNDE